MRNFQTDFVDKIKTYILCSITFIRHRALYEITWKNIVQPDRSQMKILRVLITRWIPTATHTHTLRICNTYSKEANIRRYAVQHTPCPVTQCFVFRSARTIIRHFAFLFYSNLKNIRLKDLSTSPRSYNWPCNKNCCRQVKLLASTNTRFKA